jgi:hypothetical protein
MILRDNKGAVLNASSYLQVSDFMFTKHATQPYGYCAVLQPDGDLQFFYCSSVNPVLGTGPGPSYFSQLTDAPGHVYKDPSFTFDPGSAGNRPGLPEPACGGGQSAEHRSVDGHGHPAGGRAAAERVHRLAAI